MPFLDHLEELRSRILKSLAAIILAFGAGFWIVQRFNFVSLMKDPIAPYLVDGKLAVLSPTEPVMIVLKLGFIIGLVLASPVLIWQVWAFMAPALYQREKRAIVPALFVGLLLFLGGAAVGYLIVVPQALQVLFSFQNEALAPVITYAAWFSFVLQVVLALGISFELPLVIIVLASLGVVDPPMLARFRRYALVLACLAGALLSPGADVLSMIMMTVPLIFLYEVGYLGAVVIARRRKKAAARAGPIAGVILFLLLAGAGAADAQVVKRPPKVAQDTVALPDTLRPAGALDSAQAARLGLPTAPTRPFPEPDSIMEALISRTGYQMIRYQADSATLYAEEKRILLEGEAATESRGSVLEANRIMYVDEECMLAASGDLRMFDEGSVVVGDSIRYNSCRERSIVTDALTNFTEGSTVWFLRGNVAQDSSTKRVYASSGEFTSCDLPVSHYHFQAGEVKWISKTMIVARPAILYIRDVPVMWLPFIFQDTRPGRRSGILIPQFGINDIVRPNPGYNRQVTNLGYYWAPSEYFDLTARMDWYANRFVQFGLAGQYRVLDRFLSGNININRQQENTGGRATSFRWDHRQSFGLSTTLNFNVNYVTNTSIVQRNAIDPILSTQQITSSLNFTRRFGWGALALGGNRRQNLNDESSSTQFPALTITPKPIDLSSSMTWSPALSFTNDLTSNSPQGALLLVNAAGGIDTVLQTADSRTTAFNLDTPLRIGSFNWRNSVSVIDRKSEGLQQVSFVDPTDSSTVTRVFSGDFSTGIDWNTGINLPTLFRSSWKIQPVLGIANATTAGPFALRNRNTNGAFVMQGKRFSLTLGATPTFFGFLNGFGPLSRIRHSISPVISFNYSPEASVPDDYARALAGPGETPVLTSPARQTISMSLNQNIEAKGRPAPGDTAGADVRKFRILSLATSAIAYDFEQAKLPGRSGWTTQTVTNSIQSDLLRGFNLSISHDLWRGVAGFDSSSFDPFLQNVNASFAITEGTFSSLLGLIGIGSGGRDTTPERDIPPSYIADIGQRRPGSFYDSRQPLFGRGQGFTANFNYSLSRSRTDTLRPTQQNLGFSTSFSPTALWSLSWSAQYNITDSEFESQVVRLERDLHEWRAGFNFIRNANGNVAFSFTVYLTDLPDLKFDYDQTTIRR